MGSFRVSELFIGVVLKGGATSNLDYFASTFLTTECLGGYKIIVIPDTFFAFDRLFTCGLGEVLAWKRDEWREDPSEMVAMQMG